jgi:hypothetical protein
MTEKLAAIFEENLVFEDITEAAEPSRPWRDYMPAHVLTQGLGPPLLNPIRVHATTSKGDDTTLAATTEAVKLITNKIKLDGRLKGRVPNSFNGDWTKTQAFMNMFDLFWMTNDNSSMMTNPYKRSTYFLGLVNGPSQSCRNDRVEKTLESLWDNLKEAFKWSFAHMGWIEQAQSELNGL